MPESKPVVTIIVGGGRNFAPNVTAESATPNVAALDWIHTVVQNESGTTGSTVLPRIPMAYINHGEIFMEDWYWH